MSILIVAKGTLKLPGQAVYLRRGDAVPVGAIAPAEACALLAAGILAEAEPSGAAELGAPLEPAGRWTHDPAALAGRDADQLRAMILDGDPSIDADDLSEAAMVQLLTSDFQPSRAPRSPTSVDRHRPAPATLAAARRSAAPRFVYEERSE
jgi:hypothetical protein